MGNCVARLKLERMPDDHPLQSVEFTSTLKEPCIARYFAQTLRRKGSPESVFDHRIPRPVCHFVLLCGYETATAQVFRALRRADESIMNGSSFTVFTLELVNVVEKTVDHRFIGERV